MNNSITSTNQKVLKKIIDYYDDCWLTRFSEGHNPSSHAMHLGVFEEGIISNDVAKLNTNKHLIDLLNIPESGQVNILDMGCGIGGTCFSISKHNASALITGVNISETQISHASKLAKAEGFDNISFQVKDYAKTNLEDSSCDFVYGIESICHAEDKHAVFKESYRVLRRGGAFAMLDYFEMLDIDDLDEKSSKLLKIFREGWAVNKYHNKESIEILTKVGFRDIVVSDITENVMLGIQKSYAKSIRHIENQQTSELFKKHSEACIALKKLVDMGVIKYQSVLAYKNSAK